MPLKRVLKSKELYLVILKSQWVLLGIGILVSGWTSLTFPVHIDEEVFINIARTIVQGGAPYRDIVDNKPPGIYLFLAPFVAFFGKNMVILRFIPFVMNLTIGLLLHNICRTILMNREGVVVAFLYLLIAPFYQANFIVTEVPMTLSLLVGTRLAWRYHKIGKSRARLDSPRFGEAGSRLRFDARQEVVWAGFWMGMAVLFKQPAVVYALFMPFFLFYSDFKRKLFRKTIMLLGLYSIGIFIPIVLMLPYLISHHILAESYQQIVVYNLQSYNRSPLSDIVLLIPQIISPIVLLWVFRFLLFMRTEIEPYYVYFISCFIVVTIPFLLFRPYHHYWIPVLPFVLLLSVSKLKRSG